jgi:hypothetical protein
MNQPGECKSCPSDRAICLGGTNIGPIAGYWRSNNLTSNFIQCLYPPACLGMLPPDYNPIGNCDKGYEGILCSECSSGFTRSREYQCSECREDWWYMFKAFLIVLVLIMIVYIIRKA